MIQPITVNILHTPLTSLLFATIGLILGLALYLNSVTKIEERTTDPEKIMHVKQKSNKQIFLVLSALGFGFISIILPAGVNGFELWLVL